MAQSARNPLLTDRVRLGSNRMWRGNRRRRRHEQSRHHPRSLRHYDNWHFRLPRGNRDIDSDRELANSWTSGEPFQLRIGQSFNRSFCVAQPYIVPNFGFRVRPLAKIYDPPWNDRTASTPGRNSFSTDVKLFTYTSDKFSAQVADSTWAVFWHLRCLTMGRKEGPRR
jgi:hypothetical protein